MPNNTNERKGKQAGELSAEERFRNFFSTSVIDLPEEMTRRDEPVPVEEKPKAGPPMDRLPRLHRQQLDGPPHRRTVTNDDRARLRIVNSADLDFFFNRLDRKSVV